MFRSACSVLCAVILSACSNSTPPASDSKTASESAPTTPSPKKLPDPCSLITQAEVNAAMQIQFEAGNSSKMPPEFLGAIGTPLNCSYKSGNQQVTFLIYQGTRPYDTQKGLSGFQKKLQPVAGIGDSAFWDTASTSLWVQRGDVGLTLQFDRIDKASSDSGKELLLKALSRAQNVDPQ